MLVLLLFVIDSSNVDIHSIHTPTTRPNLLSLWTLEQSLTRDARISTTKLVINFLTTKHFDVFLTFYFHVSFLTYLPSSFITFPHHLSHLSSKSATTVGFLSAGCRNYT